MFTDSGTSYIPRAKNWNKMGTQNVTTVATTTIPLLNMGTCVSKFVDFVHSIWNPFSIANNQNHLLQARPQVKDFASGIEGNLGLIVDLFMHSQLLPSEIQEHKLGFSLLKALEFENLMQFCAAPPEGLPTTPNFMNCDIILNSGESKSLFSHHNTLQHPMAPSKTNMENILPRDLHIITKMHTKKNKVLDCPQENSLVPCSFVNKDMQNCTVNMQTVIHMVPERISDAKPTASKAMDNSTLNQELIVRKSKKVCKVSKKRRRRQRKKTQKVKSKPSSPKIILQNQEASDEEFDDFQIIFDEPPSPKTSTSSSVNVSVRSDDFCIEFSYDEVDSCSTNTALSMISERPFTSESEDDSDFNNSYDNTEFEDLSFSIETCFISGLSSVCAALTSSTISGKFISDDTHFPEMSPEMKKINEQWEKEFLDVPSNSNSSKKLSKKKVSFAPDLELVSILSIEVYDRKGEWETYALERCRFKRRIADVEKILAPCLSKSHREKVWHRLQDD